MEYDLKKLVHATTVARTGNFSKAAELLHITQPALSRSIASLEQQFGIKIFERGRGGAELTPVGKLAIQEAEDLLRHARNLQHNIQLYSQGDAGQIAFGMGPLMGSLILPSLSSELLQSRPRLQIRAITRPTPQLLQDLIDDEIELLFCGQGLLDTEDGLAITPVGRIPIAHIVRSGHPLAKKRTVTREDLSGYPLLCGIEIKPATAQQGNFICDNYHVLRETTLGSNGVWISSPSLVAADIAAKRLVTIKVKNNPLTNHSDVLLVRRADRAESPSAALIANYVKTFLASLE